LEVNDVDAPQVSEPLPSGRAIPAPDSRPPWRVAVLGAGGIGGLLAALLARDGDKVACVAPPATAAHLRQHGIEVRSGRFGSFRAPVDATTRLEGPVDVCYVAVKATSLEEALDGVPPAALGDGLVVPFLNGIDHVALLRRRYPADQVVAATIKIESTRVAPGVIEQASPFTNVELAYGIPDQPRVEALAERLRQVGFDVKVRDNEPWVLWAKLAVLAPIALVTTWAAAPLGEARERHADELKAVAYEAVAAARADGVDLDPSVALTMMTNAPASMRSSMQRDAEADRPIEVDAIGGSILRAAARANIDTPVTTRLVKDLQTRTH